mmetsp:Transcript_68208/g.142541  ORF Transcript_68208/g.142541 Transcript_68208/m.142541 type:complete len:267 (-) Transcript_68208:723-1523(-)
MQQRGGRILGSASSMAFESLSAAGCISGQWKAPPAFTARACSARAAMAFSQSLSMVLLCPAQTKPAGKRTFAIWQTGSWTELSAAFASRQSRSKVDRSRPATDAMPCGARLVASCMASALSCTSLRQSSKSSTPAAQIAVYSPRLRPATACGRSTTSFFDSRNTSTAARPATKRTGWQYFVSDNLASGPLVHNSKTSQPKTDCALESSSFTAGSLEASANMPMYCDPCPGKSMAAGRGGFAFSGGIATWDLGKSAFSTFSRCEGIL